MAGGNQIWRRAAALAGGVGLVVALGCDADQADRVRAGDRGEKRPAADVGAPSSDQALAAAQTAQRGELVERTRSMNVLLIVVDAMRADLLEDTEDNRRDFPNLFRLRDESRWFGRGFAPGAGTDVSMSGVFTGRIDSWNGIEVTLAEALRETGRRTHAVVPNEVFYFAGTTLLSRGIDRRVRLVTDPVERNVSSFASSKRTTRLAIRFLEEWAAAEDRQPFFSWVHYFDVHEHHQIPTGDKNLLAANDGVRGTTPAEKYRALARLVDRNVGQLLDHMRASGLLDQTVVVLMSDHGEGLRTDPRLPDHHGQLVYNDLVHVPLAVRVPGVAPRVVEDPVSLIDLYPTVIELAGGVAPERADGVSLVPHLLADPPSAPAQPRVLPLNEVEQIGVVRWPYKLLVRRDDQSTEVYDLSTDWDERHDLAAERPELAEQLRAAYERLPPVVVDRTRKAWRAHELAARQQ